MPPGDGIFAETYFMKLKGRRILLNVPEKKESVIQLSEKDQEDLLKAEYKKWQKLTVFAVGENVESVQVGDSVYLTISSLENAERIDIDGSPKMMVGEHDIAIVW